MNVERLTNRQLDNIQEAARLDAKDILAQLKDLPRGKRRAILVARLKNRLTISSRCQELKRLIEDVKKKEAQDGTE